MVKTNSLNKEKLHQVINNVNSKSSRPPSSYNSGNNLNLKKGGVTRRVSRISQRVEESLSPNSNNLSVTKLSYRTKKGNVTAEARDEYGIDGDKFPVFDVKSALNAIKLRHNSNDISARRVLDHVARSKFRNNPRVKKALEEARERDKNR